MFFDVREYLLEPWLGEAALERDQRRRRKPVLADERDRQGHSQQIAVERHIKANGGTLVEEFREIESGKSHRNRPQLLLALQLCKRQRAVLVVGKLDRLGRNVHFISGLLESGVDFICCDNPGANKMTIQLLSVFAEFEREQISARTKAGLEAAKARGTVLGVKSWTSARDYREVLAKARQVANPNPPPPAVVELMRQMRREKKTLRAIAAHLNGLGLRTPRGSVWWPQTVSDAMRLHHTEAPLAVAA